MRTKQSVLLLSILLLSTSHLFAHRAGFNNYNPVDVQDFKRFAQLNLTYFEWIYIAVGIMLILIAKSLRAQYKITSNILGCLGLFAAVPLLGILLEVAQKAIGNAIIPVLMVSGLYYIYGTKG